MADSSIGGWVGGSLADDGDCGGWDMGDLGGCLPGDVMLLHIGDGAFDLALIAGGELEP